MKKTVFEDKVGNVLDVHINNDGDLTIHVGDLAEDYYYNGWICLDKEDVTALIEELKRLLSEM